MSDLLEGKDVGDEVVIFDWLRVRNMEHRRARLATISRVTPKYVEISIDGIPFNENMTNKRNGFFKKDMGSGRYGTLSLANKEALKQVAEFKLVIKKAELLDRVEDFIYRHPVCKWELKDLERFAGVFMGDG